MSHNFTFKVNDIEAARVKAKAKILAAGGVFNNNSFIGRMPGGDVVGHYDVDMLDNSVTVFITGKPMMIPMRMIEKKIKEFFQ